MSEYALDCAITCVMADLWRQYPEIDTRHYVPITYLAQAIRAAGRSRADFERAIGGNRALNPARAWYWQPIYGREPGERIGKRWFPREALAHIHELRIPDRGRHHRKESAA